MLTITNVSKAYTPATAVLHQINLTVQTGEIVCLLGPSGCGKTTLLRIVAGLEQADSGQITLAGHDLSKIPVHQRNFGLMFQEFALFPHRTVAENIAFGLRMNGQSREHIAQRVQEVLALVNLEGYDQRSIFALSGGERQRVALARSLAPHPQVLMLDEPLGSLDRALREELMVELRTILKAVGVTAIYVTHDQQEAFAVADRLVVMRQGQIEQVGTPSAVYQMPASAFVARFLGFHNLLSSRQVTAVPALQALLHTPPLSIGQVTLPEQGYLLIRPDAVRVLGCSQRLATDDEPFLVTGKLQAALFRGSYYQVLVAIGEEHTPIQLRFDVPDFVMRAVGDDYLQPEQALWLQLDPAALAIIGH